MTDAELQGYCYDWLKWCATRKYYLAPGAKNILARMQPGKVGQAPNARNDPLMPFFNMAVHALSDMKKHEEDFACFSLYYIEQAPNVKVEAARLGISRPTYYNRARAFARCAHSMAGSLKTATELMNAADTLVVD